MLYEWLTRYADDFQVFNLFNYITFRVGGALMTSMIIAFILGPRMINLLRSRQGKGQPIRCLLYTSPSPRDKRQSRMPSSA